jgi:biotin-(acetyl-CoA carboxylase) ligase
MEKSYTVLLKSGSIYEEWRNNLVTIGKRVSLDTGEAIYEGVAESVNRDGSLMLRQSDGNLTRVVAGDVNLNE